MVPDGLAESEVYLFVEELRSKYEEARQRLDHLDALYELATRTLKEADENVSSIIADATERARIIVEDAEEKAHSVKSEAKTDSERQASSTISLAERRAQEMIAGAQATVERLLREADSRAKSLAQIGVVAAGKAAAQGEKPDNPPGKQQSAAGTGATRKPAQQPESDENKTRPTFRWNAVPRATRYGLYVCGPPYGKDDFVFVREDIKNTSLTLPVDLEKGVTYQWTIRAGNARAGVSPLPSRYTKCNLAGRGSHLCFRVFLIHRRFAVSGAT